MDNGNKIANSEIERLKSFGFHDWKIDQNGVRIRDLDRSDKVSFPIQAYEKAPLSRNDFWSRHRVEVVADKMKKLQRKVIWEIGGGDGRMSIPLSSLGIGVISIEPYYEGCFKVAAAKIPVFRGTLEDLELPSNSVETIGFFDVLEHIENESDFLSNIRLTLQSSGMAILTVPAHQWLFSSHDEALGHYRRYHRRALVKILEQSGFRVLSCEYLFSFLVLPALLLRRVPYILGAKKTADDTLADAESVLRLPKFLDLFLSFTCKMERKLKLPFGLSLIAVVQKD